MPNGGGSPPYTLILFVILVALTWFYGWLVPVIAVGLVLFITGCVAVYDVVSHDERCRWCNRIKRLLEEERGIALDRIKTKHTENYATHMLVQVYVDDVPDVLVDIDYNEYILGIRPGAD